MILSHRPPLTSLVAAVSVWLASASARRKAWLEEQFADSGAWWLHGGLGLDEEAILARRTAELEAALSGHPRSVAQRTLDALIVKLDTLCGDPAWLERPDRMLDPDGDLRWSHLSSAPPMTPAWSPMAGRAVILADTLVGDPDDAQWSLGQPIDDDAARDTLQRLSGRTHTVHSSTAVLWCPSPVRSVPDPEGSLDPEAADLDTSRWTLPAGWRLDLWQESAQVTLNDLTPEVLDELISTESWRGKAGAYDLGGAMRPHVASVDGPEVVVLGLASAPIRSLLPWVRA